MSLNGRFFSGIQAINSLEMRQNNSNVASLKGAFGKVNTIALLKIPGLDRSKPHV